MSLTRSSSPDVSETNVNGADKSTKGSFSLESILNGHHDEVEHPTIPTSEDAPTGWDEEQTERPLLNGYCIECEGLYSPLNVPYSP